MNEPKFTEGPWLVDGGREDSNLYIGTPGEYDAIGQIWNHGDGQHDGVENAHLIAAAPDLYASLLELTTDVDNPPSEEEIDEMDKRAIKALAKARGEL